MPDDSPALVVVAAGGLGTRVHGWAQFIPKEFYPVGGRPGITRLLEEIAGAGPARVVIVYHPYYEQFAAWARQVLSPRDHARYARAAGTQVPAAVPAGLTVSLIPQDGPYGDLTSVFNGAGVPRRPGRAARRVRRQPLPGHQPAAAAAQRRRRRRRRRRGARQQVPSRARAQPGHPHHQPRHQGGTAARQGTGREAGPGAGQGPGTGARDREPAHARGQGLAAAAVHPVRPRPPACNARRRAEAGPGHRRVRPRASRRGGSRRRRRHRPRRPGGIRPPRGAPGPSARRPRVTPAGTGRSGRASRSRDGVLGRAAVKPRFYCRGRDAGGLS